MIEWLQNFSGQKSHGPNMERSELENLRKEMAKYKKKYAAEDEELGLHSQSEVEQHIKSNRTNKTMRTKIMLTK